MAQTIGITSPVATTSFCAGSTVNVVYTVTGTFSNSPAANIFSAQVSDVSGSFGGGEVTIGTRTATTGGTITCTLPSTLLTGASYRFRVISSNPPVNGSDNGANLTVFAITINSPTITQTSLCQNESFTVSFSQSSCPFLNTPAANVYSVEMSNATGSFTNPVVIGTLAATVPGPVSCALPPGTPAGAGYRFRITASNPVVVGPDNGSNVAVIAPTGTPTVFGNGAWNVYCFETRDDYTNNYQGLYTETALSFNTSTRWASTASPSSANATGGTAYSGCPIATTNYAYAYKRTNIPCGYYQIDVPIHRNEVYLIINGVTVFQHSVCCDAHTAAWRGVINTTDQIEVRSSNLTSTAGSLAVTFTKLNQVTLSAPVTVCANTSATLIATNTGTLPVSYAWTPTVSVSPTTGATTVATPSVSTNYTVTATASGCPVFTNAVLVTVKPTPTVATSITSGTICNGFSSATITATGANTYSWAPSTGLSATTGNTVVASPTVNTSYTVTGSNNCTVSTAVRIVTVQNVPSTPSPTVFGTSIWNVSCYTSSTYATYYGYYTENSLSFTTTSRWAASSSPSSANATTGSAYTGCNLTNASHGTIFRRQNFPCGYYRINITGHDDNVTLFVNGTQVFQHIGTGDSHVGAWTGFLGGVSNVEIRHANTTGATSSLAIAFATVAAPALSPPVTICAGSSATLTAATLSGVNYSWSPSSGLSTTTGTVTIASPTTGTNYSCVVTDTATGCTSSTSTSVTVNPVPTTSVSPTAATINCAAEVYTLTATGANTYSWFPSAGLSASTGYTVVASPTVSTNYTVIGSNNCSTVGAVSTISVVPLVTSTMFPSGTWNAYCFNSTNWTNYYGYYTENGSGTSGYDFNTNTRWTGGTAPSNANNTNGQAYRGCTMPSTNWTMSFRRQNFTCNTYSIVVLSNFNTLTVLINGVTVASRAGSTSSAVLWVGPLTASSTVEFKLQQTTGTSGLSVSFAPAASSSSLSVWAGATSNNWFTSSNWCGAGVPTSSTDVLIYNTGTPFQPAITSTGAACANLTISAARAAVSGSTSAIPAATLTMSGSVGLDVYGNWINNGGFASGSGTVNILGSGNKTISCITTQTFSNLSINTTGTVTMSSGIHRIGTNMNLTQGIVDLAGSLYFLNGATTSNASSLSYVDGQIVKFGNQAFTFPLGFGGYYRPISISAPVSTTDNFTAEYFYGDPSTTYTHSSKDASIDHIGRCEYWILNRTGGSSVVKVTLSWDAISCGVNSLSDLLVSRWDAGQVKWKDHGNGGTTGNTGAGTVISSAPVSVFSPFTIGSKTALNPLPIELLDFKSSCDNKGTVIEWVTVSEQNNDYFILESITEGGLWMELKRVPSKGSGAQVRSYEVTDPEPKNTYYRLSQVDKDAHIEILRSIYAECRSGSSEFKLFPNPAKDGLTLMVSGLFEEDAELSFIDNLGKVAQNKKLHLKRGMNIISTELAISPGVYVVRLSSNYSGLRIQKLIVE